jgi:hypothetical protein
LQKDNLAHVLITSPGKSVFIFYALLHLLARGLPVALQCDTVFFIFSEDGAEMHGANSMGLFFSRSRERAWALTDSTETSRYPCKASQAASRMGRAWVVLSTSPAKEKRYNRLRKCNAGIFVMDSRRITGTEVGLHRKHSILSGLFTQHYSWTSCPTFRRELREVGSLCAHLPFVGVGAVTESSSEMMCSRSPINSLNIPPP